MRLPRTLAWLLPLSAAALGCNTLLGFDQDYKTGSGTTSTGGASGGTAGSGTTGTTGGTGGGQTGGATTGTGGAAPCTKAEDCPVPPNSCSQRACDTGACAVLPTQQGTAADQQTAGDCGKVVCDGTGSITLVADPTDVPVAQDECHVGSCEGGPPHQIAAPSGKTCSVGGKLCNGAGACVECLAGGDCPSNVCAGNACQSASCGDSMKDGGETDVDCGGVCGASCPVGKMCTGNGDCLSGYCSAGVCALVPVGSACSADTACASGFCVAGTCCGTSCLGSCNTCSSGTCTPVSAGSDPGGSCAPSVCNGGGTCGVCEPGTEVGQCCMNCAKGPAPESALPADPGWSPPCCYMLLCGPNGEPEPCL